MQKQSQQQQQPQIPPQVSEAYRKIKQEYSQLFKIFLDLEEENKEHQLVLDTIKGLEKDRNCWRKVGGVLVKRTVGEVIPALKENMLRLDQGLAKYSGDLKKRENDLLKFEIKHGLRKQGQGTQLPKIQEENQEDQKGILA